MNTTYRLCIREPYYRLGMYRVEHFTDLKELYARQKEVTTTDRTKTWID